MRSLILNRNVCLSVCPYISTQFGINVGLKERQLCILNFNVDKTFLEEYELNVQAYVTYTIK
jgi:hypothetical protein